MKKNILHVFIMTIFIMSVYPAGVVFGDSSEKTELSIEVKPKAGLFNVTNMKPGDWAPRSIVIKNNGKMDFEYDIHIQNQGKEKLFNELILDVKDNDVELYNGKMTDFNLPTIQRLMAGDEAELQMTIRFPEHLSNEYQGLDTHFLITFTATGAHGESDDVRVEGAIDSDDTPRESSVLPKTATNTFTILFIGGILLICGSFVIKFHKV